MYNNHQHLCISNTIPLDNEYYHIDDLLMDSKDEQGISVSNYISGINNPNTYLNVNEGEDQKRKIGIMAFRLAHILKA